MTTPYLIDGIKVLSYSNVDNVRACLVLKNLLQITAVHYGYLQEMW